VTKETAQTTKYYTIGEAAEILGVSVITLRTWETKGKIYCVKTPLGTRRYSQSEVSYILRQGPRKRKKQDTVKAPGIDVEIGVSWKSIVRWKNAGLVSGSRGSFFYLPPYRRFLQLKGPWNFILKYTFGAVSFFLFILSFVAYLGQLASYGPKASLNQFSLSTPPLLYIIRSVSRPPTANTFNRDVLGSEDKLAPVGSTGSTGITTQTENIGATGATGVITPGFILETPIIKEATGSRLPKIKK
jgi:hypothetical protein